MHMNNVVTTSFQRFCEIYPIADSTFMYTWSPYLGAGVIVIIRRMIAIRQLNEVNKRWNSLDLVFSSTTNIYRVPDIAINANEELYAVWDGSDQFSSYVFEAVR